jgi:hypothetical protein
MKKLIAILTFAALTACPLAVHADNSIESDPAYLPIDKVLDFKVIPPQVNVNIPRFLLKDALSGLTNLPGNALPRGVDLPDLLKDVKLIRVVVIESAKTNRAELKKAMKALHATLDSKWTSIVSVPESNVGIYVMGDPSGESMAGLAVLIDDDGEAVIVNIVGHVSIGKLIGLASQMNTLPKDFLKQLQNTNGVTIQKHESKAVSSSAINTNQPVEAAESAKKESANK